MDVTCNIIACFCAISKYPSLNVLQLSLCIAMQHWQLFLWALHTGKAVARSKGAPATCEWRLLLIIFWKAAFVWVTPYLVQLTFSLEACSWKNGDLVFQRWSFFSILETCMGIDDPYVKKPRWRRNWNAISKMIKDGLAEGMVTRKLCVEVLDLVLTSFQTSFFSGHHE